MLEKTIAHLEYEILWAKENKLIEGYERIPYREYFIVKLLDTTTDEVKQKLKQYIRDTYKDVHFVTTGAKPNDNYLYVKYT